MCHRHGKDALSEPKLNSVLVFGIPMIGVWRKMFHSGQLCVDYIPYMHTVHTYICIFVLRNSSSRSTIHVGPESVVRMMRFYSFPNVKYFWMTWFSSSISRIEDGGQLSTSN